MKKDIQKIDIPFTITLDSIDKVNYIITNMENKSFHNHYHILYDLCNSFNHNEISYLEIGAFAGGSASLVSTNPKVRKVYSVDLGTPINKEIPIRNVNKFKNKNCSYDYFEGSSFDEKTISLVEKTVKSVDILFIDGDHSHNGVLNDFKNFSNLVKPGGYIVFDDYMDNIHSPKVKGAVDYIVSELLNDEYDVYGSLIYPEITNTNIEKPSSNEFIIRKKI
jgi:predicted O-methyltransferase YrrM